MTGRDEKRQDLPKRCSPFRNISGDVIKGDIKLIDGKASFNN